MDDRLRLVACPVAAIVHGDHPVAGIAERLQPARMDPVDVCSRGKAVDQQHRHTGRIALIKESELQSIMGEA
jgi:hypothetical protein